VLGCPEKVPTEQEMEVRVAARRSVTLKRDVAAGVPLSDADLTLLRPGDGVPPSKLESLYGRRLRRNMTAGTTLHSEDLD